MRLLVSGATAVVSEYASQGAELGCLGVLLTPAAGNRVSYARDIGLPAAADNAAFTGFNAGAFCRMLGACAEAGVQLEWVTAPDVVCDAMSTILLWDTWRKRIESFGYTPALVLQNGMTRADMYHLNPGAVFVGGDDGYKLGHDAAACVRWARSAGKPAHMGRVNSMERAAYARRIGCTSIDGRKWSAWSRTYIPGWVSDCRRKSLQPSLC